ncbi:MAG: hypothetical protein ABI211_04325 [Vicinamibacterales bacterium]
MFRLATDVPGYALLLIIEGSRDAIDAGLTDVSDALDEIAAFFNASIFGFVESNGLRVQTR